MKRRAVIVHLDGLARLSPLVGGYLKAFAMADPQVRATWEVELYRQQNTVKASYVIRDLVTRDPDLVAFSVYTWNAGIVRRLLPTLRGLLPRARFLLGGVEVMNVAPRFVQLGWENVAVCNSEGERPFRDVLLELTESKPDWQRVGGLTFARDGQFVTTPGPPRVQDLSELPSPWLSGVFDEVGHIEIALFETNRGCPFACEFCYWGGAIGQKIYQQDLGRLREELEWIGRRGIRVMSLTDANFGILPRDLEIAEQIVAVSRKYGNLKRILFNSSKVKPERVEQISNLVADAGMLSRHMFSLQSMSKEVLERARRTGLEREPYTRIQRHLNEHHRASMVELLWPMPGETLDSFKDGIDDLLRRGAQGFLVYPLMWLNNTGYREHTEEYGVTLLPEDDPATGGEIVVSTREVPFPDYIAGLRFAIALFLLNDCRGLYATLQLLDRLGDARFRDEVDHFSRWMDTQAGGPFAERWRNQLECFEDMVKYMWRGELADAAMHAQRAEFDRLLVAYVATRPEWFAGPHGSLLRAAVDYDLACRPYLFMQTKTELGVPLEALELVELRHRELMLRSPYDLPRLVHALRIGAPLEPDLLAPGDYRIRVDHRTGQVFKMPNQSAFLHTWICTQSVQELALIEPRCTAVEAQVAATQGISAVG
jgi:radical SAM superfamily enzyme YgiQ (UPF0313 family)